MAGDIGIREQILILPSAGLATEAAPSVVRSLSRGGGRIMHQYGERVLLAEVPPGAEASIAFESMSAGAAYDATSVPGDLTETEQLGVAPSRCASQRIMQSQGQPAHQVHPGKVPRASSRCRAWTLAAGGRPDARKRAHWRWKPVRGECALTGRSRRDRHRQQADRALQFSTAERTKVVAKCRWPRLAGAQNALRRSAGLRDPELCRLPNAATGTRQARRWKTGSGIPRWPKSATVPGSPMSPSTRTT